LKRNKCHATKTYLNLITSFSLHSLIDRATREEYVNGKLCVSLLDHVLIRAKKKYTLYSGTVPCKISDHYLVLAALTRENHGTTLPYQTARNFKQVVNKNNLLRVELGTLIESVNFSGSYTDINAEYANLLQKIENAKQKSLASVKRNHYSHPNKTMDNSFYPNLYKRKGLSLQKWKKASSKKKESAKKDYIGKY